MRRRIPKEYLISKMSEYASKPEPAPICRGENVNESLIKWIQDRYMYLLPLRKNIVGLLKERNAFGVQKYGQPLMSQDGRDDIEDARQEIGDFIQYLWKARMNGKNLSVFKDFVQVINGIMEEAEQRPLLKSTVETRYTYHTNGQIWKEKRYHNDKKQGTWKEFYDNGKLCAEKNYQHGLLHGPYKVYDSAGNLRNDHYYRYGKKHGVWTWIDPAKNTMRLQAFNDGVETSQVKCRKLN